jgi:hypothetical protein
MNKQNSFITSYCLAVAVMLALLGPLAQKGWGDFILLNDEQFTVNSFHNQGTLYDRSRVFIVLGGEVRGLRIQDSSTANISGGSVSSLDARDYSTVNISSGNVTILYANESSVVGMSGGFLEDHLISCALSVVNLSGGNVSRLWPCNSSTANISGGDMEYLTAYDSSTNNISGGYMAYLYAEGSSTVNLSGGNVSHLYAHDSSVVTFYGRDFLASGGLILDGERVLGTGNLSGVWMDGTWWAVNIHGNPPTATIRAIPEPATLLLLGLGAVMLRRRCHGNPYYRVQKHQCELFSQHKLVPWLITKKSLLFRRYAE